jgi:hypothetical protein
MNGRLILFKDKNHTSEDFLDMIWIATGHPELQCEQLVAILNMKGSCVIKEGDVDELIPMQETLELERYKTQLDMIEIY